MRIDLEPCFVERGQRFPMTVEMGAAVRKENVREEVQSALCRDVGVELPHGAGGEVSWIGECGQAVALAFLVQFFEGRGRHEQFASGLEVWRNAGFLQAIEIN